MFRLILLSALVTYVIAFPQTKNPMLDGRIVGGRDIEIEEIPYQVSLLYYGSHICGGSIITNNYIVTAAHCTYGFVIGYGFSVRAGSSIRNFYGTEVNVLTIYPHPSYNPATLDYDISLVQLVFNLVYSISIAPIRLPTLNQNIYPHSNALVSGWGLLSQGGFLPAQLQAVDVPIVSISDCRAAYGSSAITDRMICTGPIYGGKGPCQGDSGGPLVVDDELVGIVSWGYGCASSGFPAVYSSVPALGEFIADIINYY